jgi:FkbM family methyltransferase
MGAPVDVLCAAVASGSGIARFSIAERGRATNALDGMGGSQMGGVREVRHVPTVTMDQLAVHFGPPTMVKIDVEGAEMLVLRSGQQLLSKHRPTLAMEVTAENASAVTKLLGDCGYRLYDGATMKQVETAQWNTVAVAAEGR